MLALNEFSPVEFSPQFRSRSHEEFSPVNERLHAPVSPLRSQEGLVWISSIRRGNRQYVFHKMFMAKIERHGSEYMCANAESHVSGFGRTVEEAIGEFGEAFNLQYLRLVEDCAIEDLSVAAQNTMRYLKSAVSVEAS